MVIQLYTTSTRSGHRLSISRHTVRTVKIQSNIAGREKKNQHNQPLSVKSFGLTVHTQTRLSQKIGLLQQRKGVRVL